MRRDSIDARDPAGVTPAEHAAREAERMAELQARLAGRPLEYEGGRGPRAGMFGVPIRDTVTGETWPNATVAAEALGVSRAYVHTCVSKGVPCRGHRLERAGRYCRTDETPKPVRAEHAPRPGVRTVGRPVRSETTGEGWPSVGAAADALGVAKADVRKAIGRGHTCRGHRLRWADADRKVAA